MMSELLLCIPYLLYMNPEIGLYYSFSTPRCFVFNSASTIRSCNRVYHAGIPTEEEIEQIKTFFGDTPFTWTVDANDIEVASLLEQHNLQCKFFFCAVAWELKNYVFQELIVNTTVNEISVDNEKELSLWIDIIAQSFNVPAVELSKVITLFIHQVNHNHLKLYLAYYHDQAGAAGMMFYHGKIATGHWLGTLAEYRKNGLGTAITQKMLEDAQKKGCTYLIGLASAMGLPLYKQLGTQDYCIYRMYGNY